MINTLTIKQQMFDVFRVGNPDSKDVIFLMGSCRVTQYINYLEIYNRTVANNRFLIYCLDPFNYHWDKNDKMVDCQAVIKALETDPNMLRILRSVKIFIHEYFQNFGMFNVAKDAPTNIYQFGMHPELDITIPNFHDVFILFNDFVKFTPYIGIAKTTGGELNDEVQSAIVTAAKENMARFRWVCDQSDIPEMGPYFMENWLNKRFFWTFNHTTRHFSLAIWRFMVEKFLKFEQPESFKAEIEPIDVLCGHNTPLCQYDMKAFPYNWDEPVVDFKSHNHL